MNQVLAARSHGQSSRQTGLDRAHVVAALANARTRLATANIKTEDSEGCALIVADLFVFWPASGLWRSVENQKRHGYGVAKLIEAVRNPAGVMITAKKVD